MELVPTDKVREIALDYVAYDEEVHELFVHIQSEEFPKIHTIVEHLKEYEDVSAFMCTRMLPNHHVDRENICAITFGV
jgi:hypothetical protein